MRPRILLLLTCVLATASVSAHAHASRPLQRREQAMRLTATAYCQHGITRAGVPVHEGIVAADPRVLPIGSIVRILSPERWSGTYQVMDTGAAIKGRTLDIYMSSCASALRFGRRAVRAVISRPS